MFLCLTDYYIAKETILTTFGYFASRARQVYIAEAESKDVRNPWFSRGLAMVLSKYVFGIQRHSLKPWVSSKYVFGILRHLKPWVSLNLNHGKNRFETKQRNRRSTYGSAVVSLNYGELLFTITMKSVVIRYQS